MSRSSSMGSSSNASARVGGRTHAHTTPSRSAHGAGTRDGHREVVACVRAILFFYLPATAVCSRLWRSIREFASLAGHTTAVGKGTRRCHRRRRA